MLKYSEVGKNRMALTKVQKVGIGLGVGGLIVAIATIKVKAAPPMEYCCPYCGMCFATYEELVAHVKSEHPGERIPLPIEWD